jgi:glyoxylase-like metal-dependent hydrolase (beta-lactamase superfamily II)
VTGSRIGQIQAAFREIYGLPVEFPTDGRQFDRLIEEGALLEVGALAIEALHTPGHTPAHMSWRVDDALFVGDTLFMPDHGTARCDFPGGSSEQLFDSITRLYELPDATRVFVCHDYQPGGRELRFETTLGEQKRSNLQLNHATSREQFVAFRNQRDQELSLPALLLPAMQINIRAGHLPDAEANGTAYLKIPLNRV